MIRRLFAVALGEVLVLAGGYFLLHDTIGLSLPKVTLAMPQVNWPDISSALGVAVAQVNWTLAWPALAIVLGLLVLIRQRGGRLSSR